MAKQKTTFICSLCGAVTTKWVGCCPECKEWNSITEQRPASYQAQTSPKSTTVALSLSYLQEVARSSTERMKSGIKEWDRVTGGGIIPGAFIVLTGDPGIGKSTLLLKIAHQLAHSFKVLYISSEESLEQVKVRAERVDCLPSNVLFADQANLDDIITTATNEKPDLVIIDSIQNCYNSDNNLIPGSVGHLKEAAFRLMRLAKEQTIAIIASGHITKDGIIAGPKTLEHMVDAVFYLQTEDRWQTRVLRSVKNRFGTVNELGFFEMRETGLEEMANINEHLLKDASNSPGSTLISYLEGSRPLLIELQALTIASKYGIPQRIISGIDQTQVVLIASILEKYLQVKFSAQDLFFKVSGGFKIKTNTADLGIALTLLSSYFQQPLPEKIIALGEISLTGKIKPVNHIGLHIGEAEKFGIQKLLIADNQKIDNTSLRIHRFSNVYDLLSLFEPA